MKSANYQCTKRLVSIRISNTSEVGDTDRSGCRVSVKSLREVISLPEYSSMSLETYPVFLCTKVLIVQPFDSHPDNGLCFPGRDSRPRPPAFVSSHLSGASISLVGMDDETKDDGHTAPRVHKPCSRILLFRPRSDPSHSTSRESSSNNNFYLPSTSPRFSILPLRLFLFSLFLFFLSPPTTASKSANPNPTPSSPP